MFSPKFATALSKALAARSSAELAAIAAAATVMATAAVAHQDHHPKESTSQNHQHNKTASRGNTSRSPSTTAMFSTMTMASRTHCESGSTLWGPAAAASSSAAPAATKTKMLSRLARRRTIQKMQSTSTDATLESKYDVDFAHPLGEGAFGAVYIARNRQTKEKVAVKKIPKQFTSDSNFQREIDALLHIRAAGGHPNICALRENFDQGAHYYLVLDLVSGGEMFDHLCTQGAYSEADAARLVREVASALAFCHGIGVVHGDLKPENLMLSSENPLHAVIKIVDMGCSQVTKEAPEVLAGEDVVLPQEALLFHAQNTIANTPAYCPPEILDKEIRQRKGMANYNKLDPSFDMWALGVILYIMLTGVHPFDLDGTATDAEIERKIVTREAPPLRNSPLTAHLSQSAINLIEQLMQWDPEKRLTAQQMLDHPWVRGETARTGKMAGSDKKLSLYKAYKSKLEARVFADMVQWSDNLHMADPGSQQISLLERAFHNLDGSKRGYITKNDLRRLSGHKDNPSNDSSLPNALRAQATSAAAVVLDALDDDDSSVDQALSLSTFSELLSDNLKNRYFPKGHIVYREGDQGDQMYFINSGTIQVSTSDGYTSTRSQGDTFGEGALLNKNGRNTSTIKCVTPVHAIEINRQYFDRFLNSEEDHKTKIHLSEKDKTRKRERAKRLLRNQPHFTKELKLNVGDYLFNVGDKGGDLFILEEGKADVVVKNGKLVYSLEPGEMCGAHAVAFGRPRNTSTICVSPEGCIFHALDKKIFEQVLKKNPWWVKKSLRDICLRREFQKALVTKTGKAFPTTSEEDLREVFDIADVNKSGKLELDNVREMLLAFDKSFTDKDVKEILQALDLDESGQISFQEFRRMFAARPVRPS